MGDLQSTRAKDVREVGMELPDECVFVRSGVLYSWWLYFFGDRRKTWLETMQSGQKLKKELYGDELFQEGLRDKKLKTSSCVFFTICNKKGVSACLKPATASLCV